MPTGYTAKIADGISFQEFAMDCARAMGACIDLRDVPGGGDKIPDVFTPSDYHLKAEIAAQAELDGLLAMSADEREKAALDDWEEAKKCRADHIKGKRKLKKKYEAMRSRVDGWTPPTRDHENFKIFMMEQIDQSIEFDCLEHYIKEAPAPVSGAEWFATNIVRLMGDIQRHRQDYSKEVQSAETRTRWIRALRSSLL